MKVTIEPRKTTWVPFIESKARVEVEWNAKIEYTPWSITQNSKHTAQMRYSFSGLQDSQFIPSSKLIIKEDGIPLAIVETVVSSAKDRFKSTWIEDSFLEIDDRLASIEKSEITSKQLSRRVIERTWTETITRSIKIHNQTNRHVSLLLKLIDQPAQELVFAESEPAPTSKEPPEYLFRVDLASEERTTIRAVLTIKKLEKLELPPDRINVSGNRPNEAMEANDDFLDEQAYVQSADWNDGK